MRILSEVTLKREPGFRVVERNPGIISNGNADAAYLIAAFRANWTRIASYSVSSNFSAPFIEM